MASMSSWRTTRWNQVWNKGRGLGVDSFYLLTALLKKQNQTARDVLVTQARSHNLVATSFLKVDKEVGLYQYWGFLGYLREKQVGASWHPFAKRLLYGNTAVPTSGGGDNGPNDPKKQDKNKQVARVAFMITSTQRAELSERLGYEADAIKQLKPVEASLILQHSVSPNEVEEKLTGLVQDYNDELARQHQEAKMHAEELSKQNLAETHAPAEQKSVETDDTLLLDNVQEPTTSNEEEAEELDSSVELSSAQSIGGSKLWYEVVETRVSDGSAIPVALYQDEEEAKLCLELKESFADRRAREKDEDPATTYMIRETEK